jgi:sulfate-transporting ATPase
MARELEWIRSGAKARQAKGQARINAYERMLKESVVEKEREFEILIPPGPRLGTLVVEAQKLAKSYGDNLLFENVDFALPPGGIVGVIGPNGAGKTTMFKLILGQEQADGGRCAWVRRSRSRTSTSRATRCRMPRRSGRRSAAGRKSCGCRAAK